MTHQTHRVTFEPDGCNVFVLDGATLVEAAGRAGIILNQPCGGEGACGKCRVEVLEHAPEPTPSDRKHFSEQELERGWRLACQLHVTGDMVVSIPQQTRFFEQTVLTEGKGAFYPFEPNVRKIFMELPSPSVDDQRSHLDRIRDAAGQGPLTANLALIRSLPGVFTDGAGAVTAVLEGGKIQEVQPHDTTGTLWGVAFDIGTTTIVGALMDLRTSSGATTAAVAARTNPQVHFGDDVVSRISFIEKDPQGLEKLRERLLVCLNEIIAELCEQAGAEPESIHEVTAVGNTTMTHIFLGVSPSSIAHAPYVAVLREGVDVSARQVGLRVNHNANLYALPNIACFVGSDTTALMLASGMGQRQDICMGIDIGTNGEIALGNQDRLLACSCAAGPAFEGARIRYGMRAASGAIAEVVINDEIEVSTIGGGPPTGVCGSGLIDAVAELLRVGIIHETGRILGPDEAPRDLAEPLLNALTTFDGQPAVVLAAAHRSKTEQPILLTQRDIREVQLAKAAIQGGIGVLLDEFGIAPDGLTQVLLAGGFGNFIHRSRAKRIGLLPPISNDRIEFIGNAACAGAKIALASRSSRQEAERLSRVTEYVELAGRPDFQERYTEALLFTNAEG